MGFYKAGWIERGNWFITGSVGLDWKWWGLTAGLSLDLKYTEFDGELHIGPFRVQVSTGFGN